MTIKLWLTTIGALLALPVCALAQGAQDPTGPADPRVAVPPAVYDSIFTRASQPRPQESNVTPDKLWKAANATVVAAPEHGGHGGGAVTATSDAHAGHAAPAAQPVAQPAADHSKHH